MTFTLFLRKFIDNHMCSSFSQETLFVIHVSIRLNICLFLTHFWAKNIRIVSELLSILWNNFFLQKGTISRPVDPLVMPGGRRNIGRASSNKLLPPPPPPSQLLNDDTHKPK